MKPALCFVFEGDCEYRFHDEVIIHAGEFAELAGGRYTLSIGDSSQATIVLVWALPSGEKGEPE
jgi:hypothetical protein